MMNARSTFSVTGMALVIGVAFGLFPSLTFGSQQATLAISDGVYTESQAKRGADVYEHECVTCHGSRLTGGESGPALVGNEFLSNWKDKSVVDLFERTRTDMPKDSPGRLSRQQYADVIAYILKMNEYPVGAVELRSDAAALRQIRWNAPP